MSTAQNRVAIYCRLSKEDEIKLNEGDHSASIENQKLLLMEYAVEHNWTIHKIYSDDDRKGFDRDRPAFNALLQNAQAGQFNIVLCKHQSRFTRDMELVERYLHHEFVLWGIRFVSVVDHVDTSMKGSKKARQINGLINEWYSEDLSENIRAVFRAKMLDGQYLGSFACFGYIKDAQDRHKLAIDEEAAAIVREIFSLYLQGNGCAKIATCLTHRGIPTPSAYKSARNFPHYTPHAGQYSLPHGIWSANTIRKILTNQMYLGHMVQGRERKLSYKSKKTVAVPPNDWIVVRHTHAPIIDETTFQTTQTLLANRRTARKPAHSRPSPTSPHLFAGRIQCRDCGSPMHKGSPSRDGQTYHLRCRLAAKTRSAACTPHSIRLEHLIHAIADRLRSLLRDFLTDSESLSAVRAALHHSADTKDEYTSLARTRRNLDKRLQAETTNITAAYKDKLIGLLTESEFLNIKAALQQELTILQAQREQAQQDMQALAFQLNAADTHADPAAFLTLTDFPLLTHEIVNLFIDFVEIGERTPAHEQEIIVHWLF